MSEAHMHIPVLKDEVIKYLNPQPNENFVDCTLGFAGHSKAILEKNGPNGRVLGIEWDEEKLKIKNEELKIEQRLKAVNDSYANLKKIVDRENFRPVNGILLDMGMSSWDLEQSGRGFSFQKDEPLDMRYDKNFQTEKADDIINKWPEAEIERILREYGEESFSRWLAKEIINQRKKNPIKTTFQLVELIKNAIPKKYQSHKINPATKTFQALRIAVNRELENLSKVLPDAVEVLEPGGRIVVISFHSLEDRLVKNFFKEEQQKGNLKVLTKKPVCASFEEIKQNPRSRSAKLRAAQKIIL